MSKYQVEFDQTDSALLEAARGGSQPAFQQLVEPFRRELVVHSYRFLGSFTDAEVVFQETLLRAWQRLASFEERSSFRTWLYKIATTASLNAIDSRNRRAMPTDLYPKGDPLAPLPQTLRDVRWVEPVPDELLDQQTAIYTDARYEVHESIKLAFVAALQLLPGRQRAILLLRDVLGWNVNEIAGFLSMTPVEVNSVLQRARVTMQQHWNSSRERQAAKLTDDLKAALLSHYKTAWEAADPNALAAVLREDVTLTMSPLPVWFGGREDVQAYLGGVVFGSPDGARQKLVPARANGCPAFAVYQSDAQGFYHPFALHVLSLNNGQIGEINIFLNLDEGQFSRFGLPVSG